jgi:hypothetical protein
MAKTTNLSAESREGWEVPHTVDGIDDGSVKDNLAVVEVGAAVLVGHDVFYVETVRQNVQAHPVCGLGGKLLGNALDATVRRHPGALARDLALCEGCQRGIAMRGVR